MFQGGWNSGRTKMETKNALIIVNNEELSSNLESELTKRGFRPFVAADHQTALLQVELHTPDVILLDVTAPLAEPLSILKAIRKTTQKAPVIIIGDKLQIADKVSLYLNGAARYIPKESEISEVVDNVEKALHQSYILNSQYQNYTEYVEPH
jgi:DNA-binding response OmpR family regulator